MNEAPVHNVVASFERRAARAELLAASSEAARAPLTFAAGLYRAQAPIAAVLAPQKLTGALAQDLPWFARELGTILRFAARSAPPELADIARARVEEEPTVLASRLQAAWVGDTDGRSDYFSRALLQPYAQALAALRVAPDRPRQRPSRGTLPLAEAPPTGPSRCPFCGGAPWIAARRAASDADGAQRFLTCALCSTEWPLGRLRCPVCIEEDPRKLPSFQSDAHPTVRIETCETCRRYVKSLDLTLDGRLIPEVDDLVSLSMDLWAADQGYTRGEPGLAGGLGP